MEKRRSLPNRHKSHIVEKLSLRILEEALPSHWILRHQSKDDYGIDLEVELVTVNGDVFGEIFKAQVKGTQHTKRNKNSLPSLSGVRLSTLRYWLNLSKHLHIVVFLIDVNTKEVFWTPVFWQASRLIATTEKTCSIEFERTLTTESASIRQLVIEILSESEYETVRRIKWFLLNLEKIIEFIDWCDHADYGSLVDDSLFREILEFVEAICLQTVLQGEAPPTKYAHWARMSEEKWGDSVANFVAKIPVNYYLPYIMQVAGRVLENIRHSHIHWATVDPVITDLARKLTRNNVTDADTLYAWFKENARHLRNEYL